jgi:hypothetical protein
MGGRLYAVSEGNFHPLDHINRCIVAPSRHRLYTPRVSRNVPPRELRQALRSFRSGLRLALLAAAVLASSPALASGDHPHATQTEGTAAPIAPRGEGRADGISAVAVAEPAKRLVLYLDREETNEPVTGAVVEVDADGWPLKLRETEAGVYVANDWIANPGRNRLTVAYRLADRSGSIELAIDAPPSRAVAAPPPSDARTEDANMLVVAAAAVALYLVVMALFLWRMRMRPSPQPLSVVSDRDRAAAD